MNFSNTIKQVRVGLLIGSISLFLAGSASAQSDASGNAGTDNANTIGANVGMTDTGTGYRATTGHHNVGTGTAHTNNNYRERADNFGTGNETTTVYRPSAGGYGLWGLLGLLGLSGLLRRGRNNHYRPSTSSYTRTEEYTRPRA